MTSVSLEKPTGPCRPPRPGSLTVAGGSGGEVTVGHADHLGRIDVHPRVVAALARQAASEVPETGGVSSALLGRIGVGSADPDGTGRSSAEIDGHLAFVSLTLSVRYPEPVRRVAAAVREHVRERVGAMTGLTVVEVDIRVPALTSASPRRRVE